MGFEDFMARLVIVVIVMCIIFTAVSFIFTDTDPPQNGINYACARGTTMDINNQENSVVFSCQDQKNNNNFTITYYIQDDNDLKKTIRTRFGMTDKTSGVILDEKNNLIQLYRIGMFGIHTYWGNALSNK